MVVKEKQLNCGGGGGKNNKNVVVVVVVEDEKWKMRWTKSNDNKNEEEGKQKKCGGGGGIWLHYNETVLKCRLTHNYCGVDVEPIMCTCFPFNIKSSN